jgi:hypothetical protein
MRIEDGALTSPAGDGDDESTWAALAEHVWRPGKFHPGTRIPINQPLPAKRKAKPKPAPENDPPELLIVTAEGET